MKETTSKTPKRQDRIQSLQVGMSILDIISNEKRPLKFSEILEKSGMTQSNLYKYLNTLKDMKFVFQNPFDNTYSIGPQIVEYGINAIKDKDIADRLTPYIAEIRNDLNETAHINTFTYEGPMIVKMFTSSRPFNIVTEIGTILPIHSAAGKLFAIYKNDAFELWKKTSTTEEYEKIARILEKEREEIEKHRISFARRTLVATNASMAVPILNFNNELIAAIIIVGSEEDIPDNAFEEKAIYLIEQGKEISKTFGWKE